MDILKAGQDAPVDKSQSNICLYFTLNSNAVHSFTNQCTLLQSEGQPNSFIFCEQPLTTVLGLEGVLLAYSSSHCVRRTNKTWNGCQSTGQTHYSLIPSCSLQLTWYRCLWTVKRNCSTQKKNPIQTWGEHVISTESPWTGNSNPGPSWCDSAL